MAVDITSTIAYQAAAQRARNAQARVEQQRYNDQRMDKALSQLIDVGQFLGSAKQDAYNREQGNAKLQGAAAAALGQDAPQYGDQGTNETASAAYNATLGQRAASRQDAASKFNYDLQLKLPDWQLKRDQMAQDLDVAAANITQGDTKLSQDQSQHTDMMRYRYAALKSQDTLRHAQSSFFNNMANAEAGALAKAGDVETELFKKFSDPTYMYLASQNPQVMAQVQQMHQTAAQLKALAAQLAQARQAGQPNVALEQQVTEARGQLARQAAGVDSALGIGSPPQAPPDVNTHAGPGNTSGGNAPGVTEQDIDSWQ